MKKAAYLFAVLLMVALVLSGCAQKAAPAPTAAPTIAPPPKPALPYKIGVVLAQTGYYASMGVPEIEAITAMTEDINKKGGINGHPLEIVLYNNESNETKAVLAVKKLIEVDKVHMVVGPEGTGIALAMAPVFEEAETPHVSCTGSILFDTPLKKWSFRPLHGEPQYNSSLFPYLQERGVKKVAVLVQGAAFGQGLWKETPAYAKKFGVEILLKEDYDPKGTEFSPQITKIMAAKPDALIVWGAEMAGVLAIKQARDMGLSIPIVANPAFMIADIIKAGGKGLEGDTVFLEHNINVWEQLPDTDPDKARYRDFVNLIKARWNHPLSGTESYAADPFMFAMQGLKRSNADADPAKLKDARLKIRDALETTKDHHGYITSNTITPTDHNGVTAVRVVLIKIKDGKEIIFK